jgi:hypothetical protein
MFICLVINAERTSLKGGEFRGSILRTRKEMLESVVKGNKKQTSKEQPTNTQE